ncbi:hypothetical protein Tco_0432557 [Tanacetum coccineum]
MAQHSLCMCDLVKTPPLWSGHGLDLKVGSLSKVFCVEVFFLVVTIHPQGVEVKGLTQLDVKPEANKVINLKQVVLGKVNNIEEESVEVYVKTKGQKYVLGTVRSWSLPQFKVDLPIDECLHYHMTRKITASISMDPNLTNTFVTGM